LLFAERESFAIDCHGCHDCLKPAAESIEWMRAAQHGWQSDGLAAGGPSLNRVPGSAPMARILLVEDNEMNRDMLARRLQRRRHDVLIALDGEQGAGSYP
jgi:hypothetical protein